MIFVLCLRHNIDQTRLAFPPENSMDEILFRLSPSEILASQNVACVAHMSVISGRGQDTHLHPSSGEQHVRVLVCYDGISPVRIY